MSRLYAHVCPSCTSHLTLDKENAIFHCEYCGNDYDYDYFMEDAVIDRAEASLKKGEFASARTAYEFLQLKDPRNPLVLRGLLLCDLNLRETTNKIELRKWIAIDKYLEASPSAYKKYFIGIQLLSELNKQRVRVEKTLQNKDVELKRAQRKLGDAYRTASGAWDAPDVYKNRQVDYSNLVDAVFDVASSAKDIENANLRIPGLEADLMKVQNSIEDTKKEMEEVLEERNAVFAKTCQVENKIMQDFGTKEE